MYREYVMGGGTSSWLEERHMTRRVKGTNDTAPVSNTEERVGGIWDPSLSPHFASPTLWFHWGLRASVSPEIFFLLTAVQMTRAGRDVFTWGQGWLGETGPWPRAPQTFTLPGSSNTDTLTGGQNTPLISPTFWCYVDCVGISHFHRWWYTCQFCNFWFAFSKEKNV